MPVGISSLCKRYLKTAEIVNFPWRISLFLLVLGEWYGLSVQLTKENDMEMISTILRQHGLKYTVFPDKTIVVEINTSIFLMRKTYYATLRSFQDLLNLFGMAAWN